MLSRSVRLERNAQYYYELGYQAYLHDRIEEKPQQGTAEHWKAYWQGWDAASLAIPRATALTFATLEDRGLEKYFPAQVSAPLRFSQKKANKRVSLADRPGTPKPTEEDVITIMAEELSMANGDKRQRMALQ